MNDDSKKWFAARTRRNQERSVKTRLEQLDVEHFIPFRKERCRWGGRAGERSVPVIPNVVFIRADHRTSLSIVNDYGVKIWYMRSIDGGGPLIVPCKQMDDFRCVCESAIEYTLVGDLAAGDRVRVVSGPLTGVEGELIGVRKKTGRVLLRLAGIASFELTVPVEFLEKNEKERNRKFQNKP